MRVNSHFEFETPLHFLALHTESSLICINHRRATDANCDAPSPILRGDRGCRQLKLHQRSQRNSDSVLKWWIPRGLTSREPAGRLQQYGPNTVAEARRSTAAMLASRFWGLIPWMLECAIVLDLALGRYAETAVIAALLVFNGLMGFNQERRATAALTLLRQRLTLNARVYRDGNLLTLSATELVPGDLVRLRVGDIVPADIRLIEGKILADQSVLTGESLPVELDSPKTAYSGSLVRRGEPTGEVTATATRTYFGKTSELVRIAEAPPRLERLIVAIANYLAAVDVLLAAAVLITAVLVGSSLAEVVPFVLMLLVISIPHILPTMFIVSAALGSRALAENGVLVTRLSAIEDAASMDVLCLDKTGTLTENHLSLRETVPLVDGRTSDDVLRLAALASDAATQDPIDLAILQAARERGVLGNLPVRISFTPFDPSTKRSEVSVRKNDQTIRIVKGEPATIAGLADTSWVGLAPQVARLSAEGSRVLAVATGMDCDLHLMGLIALGDPVRSESAALIEQLRDRGVRVLLVTGDGEATARAVAVKVGMPGDVAPAGIVKEDLDPETALWFSIFARVLPEDKFI